MVICVTSYIRTYFLQLFFSKIVEPKRKKTGKISALSILVPENAGYTRVCGSSNREEDNLSNSVLGMDTHADVSCAGRDAYITSRILGRTCEVKGFHDSYNTINDISNVKYYTSIRIDMGRNIFWN